MTTRGIDIRQTADRIVFRASLKDSAGVKVVSGTTELRLYRVEDDGTLDVYDWTTNDFVAAGAGTPDDETTMTHRQRRDSSGADVDTGIWTAVLSTLTNFVTGQVYITQVTNTGAVPESQEREFQFGGVEAGASAQEEIHDAVHDGTTLRGTADTGGSTTSIPIKTLDITLTDTDQLKGRVILFANDTATAALRGQGAPIDASTTTAITLAAGDALTTAPAEDDSYRII
jgi:hypothetical protein